MKLSKLGWMLVVASVVMVGCSTRDDDDDSDRCTQDADCGPTQRCESSTGQCVAREDRNPTCTTAVDCLSSERCHPMSRVCVETCESSSDCPDSARTCAAVSETDSTRVCQCTTDALCNQGRLNSNLVCSNLDRVCTPKCDSDTDCGTHRTCDTATGQCIAEVERDLSCTDSTGCLASELCHPTAKLCVQTCTSGADCPDSAKTCAALSGTDARRVCRCSTDALCNADRSTEDLVCSIPDAVCIPKCTTDLDCSQGQVCETATGHCEVPGGPGLACTGEGQSNCDYGLYCASSVCTYPPTPTCPNYENFPHKGELGTTANILYDARTVSFATDTDACGTTNPTRLKIALSAYSYQPFPTTRSGLAGFFYVRTDGSRVDGTSLLFSGTDYTVSGANRERAELVVSLCVGAASDTISAGFYFTNGNFLCFQAIR
ncbi:hypothetical protein ACLESO_12715 [Pyxidicoccus sp. 3LG]